MGNAGKGKRGEAIPVGPKLRRRTTDYTDTTDGKRAEDAWVPLFIRGIRVIRGPSSALSLFPPFPFFLSYTPPSFPCTAESLT